MIIDCISDLHGHYPILEGGDLLIVAGDLTARDTPIEHGHFGCWMQRQSYKKKILIAGNHDNYFERKGFEFIEDVHQSIDVEYLCDSGTEFEGLKIWGSPWTLKFIHMNPHCMAFTCDTEEELAEKWALIPEDTDILITHGPPLAYFDRNSSNECVGSPSLCMRIGTIDPILHVFGHIHEGGGSIIKGHQEQYVPNFYDFSKTTFVNASHVNEHYQPVNKPVRVIL